MLYQCQIIICLIILCTGFSLGDLLTTSENNEVPELLQWNVDVPYEQIPNTLEKRCEVHTENDLIQIKDYQILKLQEQLGALLEEKGKKENKDQQLKENRGEILKLKTQITELYNLINLAQKQDHKIEVSSCSLFKDSPGVHKIQIPGTEPFDVLCDSTSIVIQQRIDGSENFKRNWTEYRDGFGDFQGEFFLGLEKIHRLTKSLPYELYIELVDLDYQFRYATYDNFVIGSEQELFRLKSLGTYSGSAGDSMSYHLGYAFSTYDRDNDGWGGGSCANYFEGGWWYGYDANCNLNGYYTGTSGRTGIWWYNWKGYNFLPRVKMIIRPKYTLF